MEISEAIKILGLSENAEESKVRDAYFKQQQNMQSGFTAIDKSTGKEISPEKLEEAYNVLLQVFRMKTVTAPTKSNKIKTFFEVYWFRFAVIAVICISLVAIGFSVANNIFSNKNTYNIVMMGQEYIVGVDKPEITKSIDANVPNFGTYNVMVYNKDDFNAKQADLGDGSGSVGGAPANIMAKVFSQVSNGEIDMFIFDKSMFSSMAASNAIDYMQTYFDKWDITTVPDADKRYAKLKNESVEQFVGIDLSKYSMFSWTDSDLVKFIVCIPANSGKTDKTELLIKAMVKNNG